MKPSDEDEDEAWVPTDTPADPDAVRPFLVRAGRTVSMHFELASIQSRMCSDDPQGLALDYTRSMMGVLLLVPPPRSLLMIGLGGGSMVKYLHAQVPGVALTVVEINPHVIALRDTFAIPPDDERLQVLCADGAAHVAGSAAQYDVIMVDGFNYEGQPERLCSADFYDRCRERLAPGGVLAVNLHADPRLEHQWLDRLAACFDGQLVSVLSADRGNRIVFAGTPCRPGQGLAAVRRRWAGLAPVHREVLSQLHPALLAALAAAD